MVIDAVIEPDELRAELIRRFAFAAEKDRHFSERRNPITSAWFVVSPRRRELAAPDGAAGGRLGDASSATVRRPRTCCRTASTTSPTCARSRRRAATGSSRSAPGGGLRLELGPGTFVCPDDFTAPSPLRAARGCRRAPPRGLRSRVAPTRRRGVHRGRSRAATARLLADVGPRWRRPPRSEVIASHADVIGMTIASECSAAGDLGLRRGGVRRRQPRQWDRRRRFDDRGARARSRAQPHAAGRGSRRAAAP